MYIYLFKVTAEEIHELGVCYLSSFAQFSTLDGMVNLKVMLDYYVYKIW